MKTYCLALTRFVPDTGNASIDLLVKFVRLVSSFTCSNAIPLLRKRFGKRGDGGDLFATFGSHPGEVCPHLGFLQLVFSFDCSGARQLQRWFNKRLEVQAPLPF